MDVRLASRLFCFFFIIKIAFLESMSSAPIFSLFTMFYLFPPHFRSEVLIRGCILELPGEDFKTPAAHIVLWTNCTRISGGGTQVLALCQVLQVLPMCMQTSLSTLLSFCLIWKEKLFYWFQPHLISFLRKLSSKIRS